MTRYVFYALAVALVVWIVVTARSLADPGVSDGVPAPPDPAVSSAVPPGRLSQSGPAADLKIAALRHRVRVEHRRYLAARHRVRTLTRTLQHHSTTSEAISLACAVYGNCSSLWQLARCESGLTPTARNPSGASGLFQFLPGTFASTPFASLSIWSPYANALAAGWMLTHGRRGEWVC